MFKHFSTALFQKTSQFTSSAFRSIQYQKQSFADVLKNRCSQKFRKFYRKTPVLDSLLFNKVAGLQACEIFKNNFFYKTTLVAASVGFCVEFRNTRTHFLIVVRLFKDVFCESFDQLVANFVSFVCTENCFNILNFIKYILLQSFIIKSLRKLKNKPLVNLEASEIGQAFSNLVFKSNIKNLPHKIDKNTKFSGINISSKVSA